MNMNARPIEKKISSWDLVSKEWASAFRVERLKLNRFRFNRDKEWNTLGSQVVDANITYTLKKGLDKLMQC